MFKKSLIASAFAITTFGSVAIAKDIEDPVIDRPVPSESADGELVFSGFINLVCDSPSTCGTYSSGWHRAKVYEKVKYDIPPSIEMRLYWKENVPADEPAGRYRAKTIGASCGDGTNMTAVWSLTAGGSPHYASSTDCDGVVHNFRVLHLP